jgi:hypothetical protein
MPKKVTTDNFIERAVLKHCNFYDYSKVIYKNAKSKITIICPKHGEFEQLPSDHLQGSRCIKCIIDNRKSTTDKFIQKAILKHGDFYDYSKVIYTNYSSKIIIICPEHGEFEQTPAHHLYGYKCLKCTGKIKLTTDDFIKRSKINYGNFYNYSKVMYKNNTTKVIITCPKHGDFEQIPKDHLSGIGCLKCADKTLTIEDFIQRSILKHGNLYDYSKVVYKNANSKVIIICKKHGDFEQMAYNHLRGNSCPKCCKNKYSKISISWINYVQFVINKEIQNMLSPLGEYTIPTTCFKADGYCQETNTIYEFHGDFWHGNPKKFKKNDINPITKNTYGELYDKTQEKKAKIMELGYNYVEMWEGDWKKAIKAIIKIQRIWKKKFQNRQSP